MKYKIIKTELDIPLEVGVLTDNGLIIDTVEFDGDNKRLEDICYIINDDGEYYPTPISISLQEVSELEPPKTLTVSKNINDQQEILFDIDNKLHKMLWEGEKLHSSKIIECSHELQVILLDKFNQGVTEIDESEIEIESSWNYPMKVLGEPTLEIKAISKQTKENICFDCRGIISKEGICFCNREIGQSNDDIWDEVFNEYYKHANANYGSSMNSMMDWLKQNYNISKK